ncbi:phosphotransferase [Nonomuraea sp. NBC_01738]|uniref:phosphotransferase family protein n=1 Tax=Nonomuraea sp. NBC_01738 TaxID=2976003 RepID=UPI002E0ED833|nr:phosphotransferase [Nonomuraea sp. NBC_01738]
MAELYGTHDISVDGDTVTKRFVDGKEGGAAREWRALTLLHEHAPGLAPRPIAFEGGSVVMERLHGEPVRGRPDAATRAEGMAGALTRLHTAVPREVLDREPQRPWQVADLSAQVLEWCAAWPGRGGRYDEAVKEGRRWLEQWRPDGTGVTPVFGAGDGNVANFLWDGTTIRLVDFEDSGRSDRAFELAETVEHVSSWVHGEVDVMPHVELTAAEARRFRECSRLQALTWFFLLSGEGPRNPPGTFLRQAERVLARL